MNKLKSTFILLIVLIIHSCRPVEKEVKATSKPKLVVGIVVDQMRPDYLTRFAHHFGDKGFSRIMKEGFYAKNTHYNYVPTYTGPGHASIYTGTTPATHGIIANDWYDRDQKGFVYCAGDPGRRSIGTDSDEGQMSPHRLLSTTITDELMLATNFRSKVIGISLKDRGSILPAGHMPTGSYWFDSKTGDFITSDYYTQDLPQWLKDFNSKDLTQQYLSGSWTLSLNKEAYTASTADNMPYERKFMEEGEAVFPYDLAKINETRKSFSLIKSTPYGNTLLTDLAIETVKANQMGKDSIPDFLAMSYSSSDYIGHEFGPRSIELEDMYIKLNEQIDRLINFLDAEVGKGEYVLFLTADHAAAEVPQFLTDHKVPAGNYNRKQVRNYLDSLLDKEYGKADWIENYSNEQFFFDQNALDKRKVDKKVVADYAANILLDFPGVSEVYSFSQMRSQEYTFGMRNRLQNGYNFRRSGDLMLVFQPAWFADYSSATTHGSGYAYDTHVPLLWYGNGIPAGYSHQTHTITDIAPTLAFLLNTKLPNGTIGQPMVEILDQ